MHAAVPPHVDALDGEPHERERRPLDGVGRAEIGEDRAVVIDVGVDVEEAGARALGGVAERADQGAVAPLADVRDAFEQRVPGPRAPGR
jgi:hypothetical protein